MIAEDEDALTCDLAETYRIYDRHAVPVRLLATLACGLRDDSRIKMRLAGTRISLDTMLRAVIADRLTFLAWSKTKDAEHNRHRPPSILEALTRRENAGGAVTYDSPEAFEAARAKILEE